MNGRSKRFILIHGAWHGAWCWHKIVSLLQREGHEVLAPDLPGHGENTASAARTSLDVYSRFIKQLVEKYDQNITLVGHSMGGMVISQVAEELPGRIEQLVYLNAFLPRDGDSVFGLMGLGRKADDEPTPLELRMELSADRRHYHVRREAIAELFYNRCRREDIEPAVGWFSPQSVLPLAGKVKLSGERFEALPKVYISCLHDRVIPISHQRAMIARQPCWELIQLEADHSPFFSAPEELAAILDGI